MIFFKKWRHKNISLASGNGTAPCPVQEDSIKVSLPMLDITLTRNLNIDVPHEVSIIVPRAEIRYSDGTAELIYSSVTVVHSPRHPSGGDQTPGAGPVKGPEVETTPPPATGQSGPGPPSPKATLPPGVGSAGALSVSSSECPRPACNIIYTERPKRNAAPDSTL